MLLLFLVLPEDASGNVTVGDVTVSLVNGTAVISIPDLFAGNYTVHVTYSGDDKYNPFSTEVNIYVEEIDKSVVILAPEVTKFYGGSERFVVNVMNSKGIPWVNKNISIFINGISYNRTTDSNGTASIALKLNSGVYNVTVTVGNESVKSIVTILRTVNGTDVVKIYSNETYYYASFIDSEGIYLKNGTDVIFNINGVFYQCEVFGNEGLARLSINMPSGDYIITAINPITGEMTSNKIKVIAKIDTNISVGINSLNLEVGDNEVILVNLVPVDAGNITFHSDNESVVIVDSDGNIIAVGVGSTNITVSFDGDDKYNPAEVNVTVTVNVKEKVNSDINVSADAISEGEVAYVSVLLPGDATGNVTVILNGESNVININDTTVRGLNGVLSMLVAYDDLVADNYTVIAIYSGDDKYYPSNASSRFEVIKVIKENITMNIAINHISEGENATIRVTLPCDASGIVTALVNGKNYTTLVKDGDATLNILELTAGNYTISVSYLGDDKYNPVTDDVNVIVEEDTSDIVTANNVTKYYKGLERFVVFVKDYQGNPIANKSVNIFINGVTYSRNTDANGTASIALGLSSGKYNVTTTVDNTTINSVVTVLSSINGNDIVKVFRNDTQYYATFYDSMGNPLKEGSEVTFNINGVMYHRKTNENGVARLNINLNAGEYILTAINPVNGEMYSNNIIVISAIINNADLVKYYKNDSQYVVTILGADGKAVGAGENVTFNINGVFYTRQTNASGQAKLNINLNPGNYIITAIYNGCMVSNYIEVMPILFAEDLVKKYGTSDQFRVLLLDNQGNPFPNQNITFNINGVFYNRTTNVDGYAALNIKLGAAKDTYIITSSYNGTSISNKIIIED